MTYGTYAEKVLSAREILRDKAINAGVVLLEYLKPYGDIVDLLLPYIKEARKVVFAEEGIKNGGAGMIIGSELSARGFNVSMGRYEVAAIDDNFASPTEPCDMYDYLGLSPNKLAEKMMN